MKRVIILRAESDYWEACYVDGKCIDQCSSLGEGDGKLVFLQEAAEKYKFGLSDVIEVYAEEVDDDGAMDVGCFPDKWGDLKGDYSKQLK